MEAKSQLKAKIRAEINEILASVEITEEECVSPVMLLLKMETTLRLAGLVQSYLALDFNYNYPPVSLTISLDRSGRGDMILSCYADSTNRVSIDAEIVKMFSYKDILKEILHELRHKYQSDKEKAIFRPTYSSLTSDNYDGYDLLWDIEPKEVDAQNFSYFYSKKFKTKKSCEEKFASPVVDKPHQTMFRYLKGKVKFILHKNEFKQNSDVDENIKAQQMIRNYFRDGNHALLVDGENYYYKLSLKQIELIAKASQSLEDVIKNYKSARKNLKPLRKMGVNLSYYNPARSPIDEGELICGICSNIKNIKKYGSEIPMWNFFTRYITDIYPIEPVAKLSLKDIRDINRLVARGAELNSEQDIIEYADWLKQARLKNIKSLLDESTEEREIN